MIRADNITKIYKMGKTSFTALDGVSLQIDQGESLAILGKSGSGKSTLMHLLAALDTPTEGNINFNGKDLRDFKSRQLNRFRNENIGFIFQSFFMFNSESVYDNVAFPLLLLNRPKSEVNEKVMEMLKLVEMEDKAKNKGNELSGGQKQRVCIARALINQPQVVFADEPTGNLDSATGRKIEEILFGLNAELNTTLVIVTHDEDLAEKCGRQIELVDGKIVDED
ncbi:MAG: ABC transporter ATP-binding protein [Candidatus Dojkabacteria bacterium]|nr:MAG: ABC transporter ATP-binding protein [Candidatus Dojkabacteria bacterium]